MKLYAVFTADGYEASPLEGVFSTQEKAEEFLSSLRNGPYIYGNPGLAHIQEVELDAAFEYSYAKRSCSLAIR